ncbi:MAG: methyltransferase domain-containing protein [Bacteroidota bacterium]
MKWYEDDRFWEVMGPKMFTPEQWQKAVSNVDDIEKLLHIEKGMAILDLCCGPGRHSLEFLRRGYKVTSVDRTAGYLDELRSRADSEHLPAEIIREDMRAFIRPSSFDIALSLFTSFGYFDEEENFQVLRNIYASLKIGGQIIIEMMGKEIIARIYQKHDWDEENGILFLEERIVHDSWNRMTNRWIKIDGSKRSEYTFSIRLYSGRELIEMVQSMGFHDVRIYGSLGGTPYDQNAERLVLTAVKKT